MCHSVGHKGVGSVEIEKTVTGSSCLIIEDTSLPVHQDHFRSKTERLVTPVESQCPAKWRDSWQRFVEFGKFRSHVVHFAIQPQSAYDLGFYARLCPNETAVRLRVVNNRKI